jgi:hypothetical protein
VAFPVVALAKSSEGWGCGIPPFAKGAKDGAASFVVVSAYSRFPSASLRAGSRLRKIIRVAGEELPRGLKPGSFGALYAALKRRSSTGLHGFVAACLHD